MSSISIFCPNSINILAGINGIEVLQSVVIALLILLNDLLYIHPHILTFKRSTFSPPPPANPSTDPHLFSIYFLLPFLGVSLALLSQNAYPARVFVGDTYCYFAGMVFAVVAILAHFSKTLLLLFMPQIFNFIYSAPQLFGLVPCPRHRLPHFNARTGLLEPCWADWSVPEITEDVAAKTVKERANSGASTPSGRASTPNGRAPTPNGRPQAASVSSVAVAGGLPKNRRTKARKTPLHPLIQQALRMLATLRLVEIETEEGNVVRCTNLTLLNLWLVWFGPMREDRLAMSLGAAQVVVGLAGLAVRHRLALLVFPVDNL